MLTYLIYIVPSSWTSGNAKGVMTFSISAGVVGM